MKPKPTHADLAGATYLALQREKLREEPITLADARVGGTGLQTDLQGASWERILEATYEGRGA